MSEEGQVVRNDDGSVTVRILNEYDRPRAENGKELSEKACAYIESQEVDEIRMRKIYAKDLIECDGIDGGNRYCATLIERLSGVPMTTIERLAEPDFLACIEGLAVLRGKSRPTGPGS